MALTFPCEYVDRNGDKWYCENMADLLFAESFDYEEHVPEFDADYEEYCSELDGEMYEGREDWADYQERVWG